MSTTRQVFLYLVSTITLGIFAGGVGQLLSLVFGLAIRGAVLPQVGTAGFGAQQLSLGLAMVVIGGPLWFLFWRTAQRHAGSDPVEIGSAIRKFFFTLILTVTAIMWLIATNDFLRWLLSGVPADRFQPVSLSILIVTGAIWYFYWHLSESEGQPSPAARTLRRWYVYILTGFTLVWLANGLVQTINLSVLGLPVPGATVIQGEVWNSGLQGSISWIVLGGLGWFFHWSHMAKGDFDSTLRQVYLYLLTILGGSVAGLVALTITLYRVFVWGLGGVSGSTGQYFQFLGWSIPTIVVGAAIWSYHRQVALEEEALLREQRLSPPRVHAYLMAFLGLGTLISGLVILFGVFLDLLINAVSTPVTVTPGWWRNQFSLSLALLLVASPLWLYYWNKVVQRAASGGITEWKARSRRIFVYGIVGAAIVALAADAVNIVYRLLNALLQGISGEVFLRDTKWSWQSLVVAVPVLIYHWRIMQQDRRRGAEAAVARKTVTLLVSDQAADIVSRLENVLGFRVHRLRQIVAAPEEILSLSDEEVNRLASEIQAAPSDMVILVSTGGKIMVLPYEEK
ncbi:MAG: hypothetical protein HY670_12535 [Chloroflexi bacterium]|nr:hypothetical protein [Chloroflexota bacterium]